ncbi:response regulator [Oculatella sp. FACHB-28]|uniref:response regulator n=1 Tax=Cyanophyceae TaxID=3028117 RepID=UPI0016877F96|nr:MULTISPECIES: response regulator [Cyanophyceae]MBD1999628.1 response regulator [Leptolyngbya sp. FACHB-541]MBD2055249.1 response regulator [Oculatella sp. FACHB-28]
MSITNELLLNPGLLKNVEILVVDNDRDSRDLYACLLESYGAKVTTISSIKSALDFLDWYIPTILICDIRFLGESIHPLIQHVRHFTLSTGRMLPIMVTSASSLTSFAQQRRLEVEAYLLKPIDLNRFVQEIWKLTLLSSVAYPLNLQDWSTLCSSVEVSCIDA